MNSTFPELDEQNELNGTIYIPTHQDFYNNAVDDATAQLSETINQHIVNRIFEKINNGEYKLDKHGKIKLKKHK